MIKHLWLALGFGLAVFVGVAVALAGPGATWVQAAPEQLSAVGVASGLTVALAVLFVMVFVGLAAIDGLDMLWARWRLDRLIERVAAGETIEPDDVVDALGGGALAESARSYAFSLRREVRGERSLVGADPTDFFAADRLIDDRLYVAAFRHLPTLLILISAAALGFGLVSLLAARAHGISASALAANGQAVLIGCALPLFAAIVTGAVVPLVRTLRRRQLANLVGRLGLLCHGADEQVYELRVLAAPSDGGDLRRSVSGALGEVRKLFGGLRRRIEAPPMLSADTGSASFERTLRAGLAELSKAIVRLSEEQDKATVRQVQQCLASFGAEFGRALAGPIERLETVLQTTESAAATLERGLGGAARAAAESGARLDATSAGVEHKLGQVVERLGQVAVALSATAERPAGVEGAAGAAVAERLDGLVGALTIHVEEARNTGATMKQLHTNVDSLCLSVAPVLNRLADTQDDLLAALSGEQSTSRLLADVAEDLRQLSRANRDTLERHAELAGEMVKIGQVFEGLTPSGPARPSPAAGAGPAPKVTDGLMRALRDLKLETDEAARSLPSLDHVA